jgi:prepilin-type N-terminal cleavage/methylation domain-containing protein
MRSRQGGLTLVELLVGLAVLALMAAAVSRALFGTLEAATCERDRAELTQAAERALQRMAAFARETDEVFEPKVDEPVKSHLKVKDQLQQPGNDVEFYWEQDKGLLKENGAWGTVILAEEVSYFMVRRTNSAGSQPLITIDLGLSRGEASVSLTTAVVPRNDESWAPPDD